MSTTTRAALATVGSFSVRRSSRAQESYEYELFQQSVDFPVCREADYRELETNAEMYAEAVQAARVFAWDRVFDLAVTRNNAIAMVDDHDVTCTCDVCSALQDAFEMDKEARKAAWYGAQPMQCGCAGCRPVVPPEERPACHNVEVPDARDVMGEQGADW